MELVYVASSTSTIKGWTTIDGEPKEKIYDVAWSGNRMLRQTSLRD